MPRPKQNPTYKRNEVEREADLVEIANQYLKGRHQRQIVDWIAQNRPYTLSQQQISYDVQEINKRWMAACNTATAERMAAALAKLDKIESEAWIAWDLSKRDSLRKLSEKNARGKKDADGSSRAAVVTEQRDGDARFLEIILKCNQERCKLLGLHPATKLADFDGGPLPVAEPGRVVIIQLEDNGMGIPAALGNGDGRIQTATG